MRAPFSSLPPAEGGFMLSHQRSADDPLLALVRFDLDAFDDSLSERWQLPLPPHLRQAVKKRRAEYLASRWLARETLRQLGVDNFILHNHSDRSPRWPAGVHASLSHTDGAVALAVTRSLQCVGVDIETLMRAEVAEETAALLMSDEEQARLRALPLPFPLAATLLFSLKESLYKALWPQLHQPMDFHQAALVAIDLSAQKASLSLTHSFSEAFRVGTRLEARFQFCDERVLTLLTHPLPDHKKPAQQRG